MYYNRRLQPQAPDETRVSNLRDADVKQIAYLVQCWQPCECRQEAPMKMLHFATSKATKRGPQIPDDKRGKAGSLGG